MSSSLFSCKSGILKLFADGKIMATHIANLSRVRLLRREQETRNRFREESEAIERTEAPLSEEDARRPFMIPQGMVAYDNWEHILNKITEAEVIFTVWSVCPMFRHILRSKPEYRYKQAILPVIVKLILDKRPKFLVDLKEETGGDRVGQRRLGHISPSRKILLSLRLISKLCKNSVEGVFQGLDFKRICLWLGTLEKVEDIIKAFRKGEVKADSFFPSNVEVSEVQVRHLDPIEREAFFEAVGVFVELAGKRFITFCYGGWETKPAYNKLVEWVGQMPNLENLEFELGADPKVEKPSENLPNFEDLKPFPECPKLRCLTLNHPKFLRAIFGRIVDANPHIITLKIQPSNRRGYWVEEEDLIPISEMCVKMPHLEILYIPLFASVLYNLEFGLPLKKLVLDWHHSSMEGSFSELLIFLEQFGDSLEHLELNYGLDCMEKEEECVLNLPRLKFFKWYDGVRVKIFENLQFLLGSEYLEEVNLLVYESDGQPKLKLESFLESVTQGFSGLNMFQVFPRLKKFVGLEFGCAYRPVRPVKIWRR